ncbi:hypothetical protein JB92DRAFT_2838140 [Gautieria morchelliformis]|nr:hypothetical protein JB92DRAFT_2838140 [Gautieria morchelliformis]
MPSDGEDREQGDGHDDSDDSDRISFFSAEEFLLPATAFRLAANAAGKVVDPQEAQRSNPPGHGWQSLELEPGPALHTPEDRAAGLINEGQDAAHALRRWHALMEIVHTEAGYVYLALLPSLQLSALAQQAVKELSQEASKLLALHEQFLPAIRNATSLVADGTSPVRNIDVAVGQVAELFIKEASTFDLYQRFCAAQPDTLRLLHPVQSRAEWAVFEQRCAAGGGEVAEPELLGQLKEDKSVELNDSAGGLSGAILNAAPASTMTTTVSCRPPTRKAVPSRTLSRLPSAFKAYASSSATSRDQDLHSTIRRHSCDSLAAVFGASGLGNVKHKSGTVTPPSESSSPSSSAWPSTPSSRLRFHDYLIKPVQRICKYPLMLEGLHSKTHGELADPAVSMAVESMRAVATRVDEARRQKESAARSALIIYRIELHPIVTTEFIRSLGDCLLAGSLDVVHHHHILDPVTTPVRVRYLGAFLYLGGYLLLVKVDKGKVYRIKHWFSLAPFELVDIPQDAALVPCSFRLSYFDHHFEIAAACQREKDLWMRAINEARSTLPTRTCEPVSSLQMVQVDPSAPPGDLDGADQPALLTGYPSSSSISDQPNPLAVLRLSTRTSASNPTVRIFSLTDDSSILLRRSSGTNRIFVDRGLVDVLSELVASMRKQAQAREEILFPPPHSSDASQTISIAAKNRLTTRGSMLVARPRTVFMPGAVDSGDDTAGQPSSAIRRCNTLTSRSRMSLLPALGALHTEPERSTNPTTGSSRPKLQAPRPRASSDKSHISSGVMSLPSSPTTPTIQQSQPSGTDDTPHNHRRTRSLVGSMRDLVRRATTRRTPVHQGDEAWETLQSPDNAASDAGQSTETAARRRVSSAPTSPPSCSRPQSTIIDSANSQPNLLTPTTSALDVGKSSSLSSTSDQLLNPRRRFKSFIFYDRVAAVDPT